MWLPTDLEHIRVHQRLSPGVSFWLEHWLLLHGDEAFGLLKARPLGLRSLAAMILNLDASQDFALLRSATDEIQQYQRLFSLLKIEVPSGAIAAGKGRHASVTREWRSAALRLEDWDNHVDLLNRLAAHLRDAIAEADLGSIAFLNRRLSSELSEHYCDAKWIYIRSINSALSNGNADVVQDLIDDLVRLGMREHTVSFEFSRVEVPAGANAESSRLRLQFDETCPETEHADTRTLVGVSISVRARDRNQALERAMELCRTCLTHLRLNFYVRTHLVGVAQVSIDEETVPFSLRQPFWHRRAQTREVPRFPANFASRANFANEEEKARWYAARDHVSTAIATWAESCHHAASSVWQALESLAGGPGAVYSDVIAHYERAVGAEIVRYFRRWISHHRWVRAKLESPSDWPAPPLDRMDDGTWLNRVMSRGSPDFYGNWSIPPAPRTIFGETGVLSALFHQDGTRRNVDWPGRRVQLDMRHLYALRNNLVHSGKRIGTDRWASYLGSLGLEIIFACARAQSRLASPTNRGLLKSM